MVSNIRSLGLQGIGGYVVRVECYLSNGLPAFDVVGLPDAAVKEARDRVRVAIKNAGFSFPVSRLTINLAPADTRKAGTLYDLPILLGILACTGDLPPLPQDAAFFGELSLTGELRPVRGALSMALCAAREGIHTLYVPAANAAEASFAEDVTVYPVETVGALAAHLRGETALRPAEPPHLDAPTWDGLDFLDVKAQENVKRALEVAAAGGHNLLMVGPPGAGKSMLAKRLPGILPDMSREEMNEATQIHSVAGDIDPAAPIVTTRPFRAPHHTVSAAAMSGGGSIPRPGGGQPCAHRRAVSGRAAGVFQRDAGGAAPAAGGRTCDDFPRLRELYLPQRLYAGLCDEPLPLRLVRTAGRALQVQPERRSAVPEPHIRSAAGPHRHDRGGPGAEL